MPVRDPIPTSRPAALPVDPAAAAVDPGKPPYLLALLAGVLVFALYAATLAPTTAFWDTSEYITTAHILGIPHPPGNPLFVLLARAWDLLLSPTGLPVAVRINLFSAVMSAGTAFFWYLVVWRILTFFTPDERVRRVGAAVSVLVSATAFTVWNQSNVNEKVYTVSMFTIGALSWLAFVWRDHVEAHQGTRGRRWHDDNAIVLMVYILALSVANHLMAFLAAPALIVFLFMVKRRLFLNWKAYAFALLFGMFGLTVHLFLPIRSAQNPIINEAAPTCPTVGSAVVSVLTYGNAGCPALSEALERKQYDKPSMLVDPTRYPAEQVPRSFGLLAQQVANYFQYFDWQWARSIQGDHGYFAGGRLPFSMLFLALGIFGAAEHRRRDRKSFWYLAVLVGMLSMGLTFYLNFKHGYTQVRYLGLTDARSEVRERDYFFLVSFSLWGLWCGVGLTALWLWLAEMVGGPRALALASPVLLLAAIPLALNWPYASRAGDYASRDWAYNLLQSVEPYGIVFTNGDNDTFPLWYVQEVEGVRRDVTVMVTSYLNTDWYVRQLRELTRPCPTAGAWAADPTTIRCQRPYRPSAATPFYGTPRAPAKPVLDLKDEEIAAITAQGYTQLDQDMVFRTRGIEAQLARGTVLDPASRFIVQMIGYAWGDRPIYFASTTGAEFDLGLAPYVARQGMAFKLVTPAEARGMQPMPTGAAYSPITGAYVDLARHRALLEHTFQYHGLLERAHWPDDATRNMPAHYRYAWQALAAGEDVAGNAAAARTAMREADRWTAMARR
ncbi:MAG TPA: DUF2723 domain-containing protein [Longimicrobiaceae bacterium]|nr:DUF2723 domain-containing protein [Longimicrobiaceae bacterium]